MKRAYANLPLHYGKAPAWLFQRMKLLAREIVIAIVSEYNAAELLNRLSDPFWFQAFGCLLGFDWHSSGLTTTACGALKEGIKGLEKDLGFFVAGGKGSVSRNTPKEIESIAGRFTLKVSPEKFIYASRMSAKVDSSALQDGFQIYHHCFIFTPGGKWAVIQQGMNEATRFARRYHWVDENARDFVNEPHFAICCDAKSTVLNLVAQESAQARDTSAWLSKENPEKVIKELKKIQSLDLPARHEILVRDLKPESLHKILLKTYDRKPENFEKLLGMEGVGAKTLRALAMISDLVYGSAASTRDPVKFSFAHGGKDGIPYPVNREGYDLSIEILRKAAQSAKLGHSDKVEALKRLAKFYK